MNIGIIGAGNIAGTVGLLWAKAGHPVRFGTRHPDELGPLIAQAGLLASAGTPAEAARFGEVVFCSVPFGAWPTLAPELAPLLSGKVVLDSANPYPDRDGAFAHETIAAGEGAGVPVARLLPGVRLVRAFNSVYFKTLQSERIVPATRWVFRSRAMILPLWNLQRVWSVTRDLNLSWLGRSSVRGPLMRAPPFTTRE